MLLSLREGHYGDTHNTMRYYSLTISLYHKVLKTRSCTVNMCTLLRETMRGTFLGNVALAQVWVHIQCFPYIFSDASFSSFKQGKQCRSKLDGVIQSVVEGNRCCSRMHEQWSGRSLVSLLSKIRILRAIPVCRPCPSKWSYHNFDYYSLIAAHHH